VLAPVVERVNALSLHYQFPYRGAPAPRRPMRRRPALPFRRCDRNCSRSGRRRQAEPRGWREGRDFIGLGRMGSAIAARVLSGDHDLLVFNRHPREGGGPRSGGRQGCRLDRGRTECSLNVQTTFLPLPNHFFHSAAHPALLGGKPSWRCQVKQETNRSSKTSRPVTLKHLAAALAEEHQLTKRAGEAAISSALSQSILRRANESVLRASVSCKVRKRAA
jgi:hypothetical protein